MRTQPAIVVLTLVGSAPMAIGAAPLTPAQLQQQVRDTSAEVSAAGRDISDLVRLQMWMATHASDMHWSGASLGIVISYAVSADTAGVRVAAVTPDGPAARAGMKDGDLILAFGDAGLETDPLMTPIDKFKAFMDRLKPGDTVTVKYLQAGNTFSKPIIAERLTSAMVERQLQAANDEVGSGSRHLSELLAQDPRLQSHASVSMGLVPADDGAVKTGALVAAVTPGGAADAAGMKSGDVITSINGVAITDAPALRALLGKLSAGDVLEVKYLRAGHPFSAQLRVQPWDPDLHP